MIEDIYYRDLSISQDEFKTLSYVEQVKHNIRVQLGIRNTIGGFCVRASETDADRHATNHPDDYDRLRQNAVDWLAERGICEPEGDLSQLPALDAEGAIADMVPAA